MNYPSLLYGMHRSIHLATVESGSSLVGWLGDALSENALCGYHFLRDQLELRDFTNEPTISVYSEDAAIRCAEVCSILSGDIGVGANGMIKKYQEKIDRRHHGFVSVCIGDRIFTNEISWNKDQEPVVCEALKRAGMLYEEFGPDRIRLLRWYQERQFCAFIIQSILWFSIGMTAQVGDSMTCVDDPYSYLDTNYSSFRHKEFLGFGTRYA